MKEKKKGNISILLDYAGGHKKLTILGCLLSGISAVILITPYICIWLAAREIFAAMPDFNKAVGAIKYGWLAVGLSLIGALIYFVALMCTHLAAFRTARNMRERAAQHLINLPLGFFSMKQSGKLRKIIDENADMTETLLAHELPDLVGAIVTPVVAVIILFVVDWKMGIVCLIPLILAMFAMGMMLGGKSAKFFSNYQQVLEELSGEATEYVRGIPVVKVFQQTVYSFKSFHQCILKYSKLATDYTMVCRNPMTAFTVILNSTFILLIPVGMLLCNQTSSGWAVLADLLFYIIFAPYCGAMLNKILYLSEAIMKADETVKRLDSILSTEPLVETQNPKTIEKFDLEFKKVTFTYPDGEKPALSQISFKVPKGATVALVGPSGGGKSTTASLVPRFWDPDSGEVMIGGINVKEIASEELMKKISFVFQDTHLFKMSLFENIRAARPNATMAEVERAAHLAQCDDIIEKLPQGLNTVVGTKGVYLSGGEQQRIALARAILKDAPIVVLDEATAFADPENEMLIQKAFATLTKGKTVIMIAHRLSTICHADCIHVISEGKIIESGTHEELLKKDKMYATMWKDYQMAATWCVGKELEA